MNGMILYPTDDEEYMLTGARFMVIFRAYQETGDKIQQDIAFLTLQTLVNKWMKVAILPPLLINETVLG